MKQKLIEIRKACLDLIREASRPAHEDDIKIIQEAEMHLKRGARVVNIQTSNININVTNNILNIIQKIDNAIHSIERPDLINGILEELFTMLLESGVSTTEFGEQMRYRYQRFAKKKEGGYTAVERITGDKRTTMHEFAKRMGEKTDALQETQDQERLHRDEPTRSQRQEHDAEERESSD